ncbi:glycosyltransferase family 4 protein [Thermococcus sp.]|uniref:glycosyltransferase family 4 protein n=1 Tax=Thermococcus sp. TaxID=35749 RepID=UPI00263316B0|nr:glycosyltransferase family 4 protein [Thermococcus sp.]
MRILLVTSGYPPERLGGAGLYVHYLALELAKRHEVHVFTVSRTGEGWEENGIRYHAVPPVSSPLRALFIDRTYKNGRVEKTFLKVLGEVEPDVVHFHNLWAFRTGLLPLLASERGYPTVQTLHDYWFICPINIMSFKKRTPCPGPEPARCSECWNHIMASYLSRKSIPESASTRILKPFNRPSRFASRNELLLKVLGSVDVVIAPSNFLRTKFIEAGLDEEKVTHIRNGYPHSVFRGFKKRRNESRLVFGFIGVPSYQKGAHVAVKAAKFLEGNFELRIYGGGGDPDYVSKLKEFMGKDERVKFMGRFEDIRIPYSSIDVLLFPSLWYENCPLVLAEAALSKTPVVASNLGAIPEFVTHGKTGFLFAPGDFRDLARWMGVFLEHPELVEEFGRAQKPPEDMGEHATRLLRVYKGLL